MNILIVEDDRFTRGMLFQMVSNIGEHDVSVVTNGRSAVSLLADPAHGFDLVFIDMYMPHLNGDKVIEIIQDVAKVHFVVLTGHPLDFPKLPGHIQIVRKPANYKLIQHVIQERENNFKSQRKHPCA